MRKTQKAPRAPRLKKQPSGREFVQARYDFTEKEQNDLAKQLTTKLHDKAGAEMEKKEVVSQIGAKIKRIEGEIGELTNKVSSGFEMRDVEARVEYFPRERKKRLYLMHKGRIDEDKFLYEAQMTASDMELRPLIEVKPTPRQKKEAEAAGKAAGKVGRITDADLKPDTTEGFRNEPTIVPDRKKKKRAKRTQPDLALTTDGEGAGTGEDNKQNQ